MNIVLSGYGRMGREVEKIALHRNHKIVAKIDSEVEWEQLATLDQKIDSIIDFSYPESVVDNIVRSFKLEIPIITGTTGWYEKLDEIKKSCKKNNGTLFYAPNFSIGVNIFFKVNKELARLMSGTEGYNVSINETHHIHKLDAPSGTAIKAANDIIKENDRLTNWKNSPSDNEQILPIVSKREDEVPGTHEVKYESDSDIFSLKHEAKNRSGFTLGAVLAAEFVKDKKGIFTMDDLLKH